MTKKILLSGILFVVFLHLQAQTVEFGVLGALTGYRGDVGGKQSLITFGDGENKRALGFDNGGAGFYFNYHILPQRRPCYMGNNAIRLNLYFTKVSGGAVSTTNYTGPRDLHFFSRIFDASVLYERTLFHIPLNRYHRLSVYAHTGIGFVHFDPQSYNQRRNLVKLKPLQTEGWDDHRTVSFALPAGAGVKWRPWGRKDPWTFGVEVTARFTTDRLDDVSGYYPSKIFKPFSIVPGFTGIPSDDVFLADPSLSRQAGGRRGNRTGFDVYKMLGVSISYTLFRSGCPVW